MENSLTTSECGRQDSNLHGLPGFPSRVPGSSSSGSQGRRVCQFHHARVERGMRETAITWRGVWEPAGGLDTRPHPPFPTTAATVLRQLPTFRIHLSSRRVTSPAFMRLIIVE